ncbi:MAG: hypothetical protein JNK63_03695 [Chthonomonas sp.]|nr:hypothetical protein [Chthonomonas sp.]
MTYDELLAKCRALDGKTLQTKTGKPFRVGIFMDCPYFIPLSTGLGRSDGRKAAERFLERWNQGHSPKTSDYRDVTVNASYFIGVMLD